MRTGPSSDRSPRPSATGLPFLGCGPAFLAVGLGTHQAAFTTLGVTALAIGLISLVRARKRTPRH